MTSGAAAAPLARKPLRPILQCDTLDDGIFPRGKDFARKKLLAFAAIGLFATSTAAWAECGHDAVAQTEKPTITLLPADTKTASAETKSVKTAN